MRIVKQGYLKRGGLLAALLATVLMSLGAAQASAEVRWELASSANTTVAPGDGDVNTAELTYSLQLKNVGDTAADAEAQPILLDGSLPAGIAVQEVQAEGFSCPAVVVGEATFSCERSSGSLIPQNSAIAIVRASVADTAAGVLTARFELSGGNGPRGGEHRRPDQGHRDAARVRGRGLRRRDVSQPRRGDLHPGRGAPLRLHAPRSSSTRTPAPTPTTAPSPRSSRSATHTSTCRPA